MEKNIVVGGGEMNVFEMMNSNVNIGIDEVVSVFISKFEDGLFEKKDKLSKRIKELKKSIEEFERKVKNGVNSVKYEFVNGVLNVSGKVSGVSLNWKRGEVEIRIEVKDGDSKYGSFVKCMNEEIGKGDIKENERMNEELEGLNVELVEVMNEIKMVSRKERKVRGRISEMKLNESGFSGLLNNGELLKLVEVK